MKKHETDEFVGTIQFISCSPHGDPEGVVLDDGSFIKVPPHSLVNQDLFEVGARIHGRGERIADKPNPVYHHARVQRDQRILADDSVDKRRREDLKEQHKRDLGKRRDAPSRGVTFKARLVAVGTKPKGEVDRLIFDDGTSVHLKKDVELWVEDVALGSVYEVEGEVRTYGPLRFVKGEAVRAV